MTEPTTFTLVGSGPKPARKVGHPTRATGRTQRTKTADVDGVLLLRCGTDWRIDGSWIGMTYNETERCWDVVIPGHEGFYARTLARAIKRLRADGHIPKAGVETPPSGSAS